MSKIKLLILLLASFFIFSCSNKQKNHFGQKYSLSYIDGELDGLLLKNYLMSNLKNLNIYDQDSYYEIEAEIEHNSNLFITNIDNTSDREKISTNLYIKVFNNLSDCQIYEFETEVSQFYIYASGDKLLSNQTAVKKIKRDNTEETIRQFINKLETIKDKCYEKR